MATYKSQSNIYVDNIFLYSYVIQKLFIFPAYITKFDDSRNSSWNSNHVYGHIDPVSSFKNTVRKISLAFDVVAYDLEQAGLNFVNIRILQQGLYPVYQKNDLNSKAERPYEQQTSNPEFSYVLSTPPVFELRYANLISSPVKTESMSIDYGLLGKIDSINFSPVLESGYYFDNTGKSMYPKLYKLNLNFHVIHHYPLGFVINKNKQIKYRHDVELNNQGQQMDEETPVDTQILEGNTSGIEFERRPFELENVPAVYDA